MDAIETSQERKRALEEYRKAEATARWKHALRQLTDKQDAERLKTMEMHLECTGREPEDYADAKAWLIVEWDKFNAMLGRQERLVMGSYMWKLFKNNLAAMNSCKAVIDEHLNQRAA
jgi:hypothetical protein